MSESFLHGVEVITIDDGIRPIRTVRSSVIGVVGTAPDADATKFPFNTPVLIAGNRREAAKLDTVGDKAGTLPKALDAIFDQIGALVVVIRVEEGVDDNATLANVVGGVSPQGQLMGVHALKDSEPVVGFVPRILVAPGFTNQRVDGGVLSITIDNAGSGYTTSDTVTIDDGAGDGAGATAEVSQVGTSGEIQSITVTNPGRDYDQGTVTVTIGGGDGAATATANVGTAANPVVSEMQGIADQLRAVIIADGPNTTDADAIQYREDFGSKRVFIVDPFCLVYNSTSGLYETHPASARVAGIIARTDNDRGFWWSPSNKLVYGISGTARPIDFQLGSTTSRANLLNEKEVATIIREDGYRLWGNRTASSDQKWAFLSVVRTADMIDESMLRAHLWAVDRPITKTYTEDVMEGVNLYLRELKAKGAILGGRVWLDEELNTAATIASGRIYFDFEFTPPYPAERVSFRSHLVTDYVSEIFA